MSIGRAVQFLPQACERAVHASVDPAELIERGSAMYWFLFLMFRFVVRRDVDALGVADIVFVVIISEGAPWDPTHFADIHSTCSHSSDLWE